MLKNGVEVNEESWCAIKYVRARIREKADTPLRVGGGFDALLCLLCLSFALNYPYTS